MGLRWCEITFPVLWISLKLILNTCCGFNANSNDCNVNGNDNGSDNGKSNGKCIEGNGSDLMVMVNVVIITL